jgi:hypothetical protein
VKLKIESLKDFRPEAIVATSERENPKSQIPNPKEAPIPKDQGAP